MIRFIVKDVLFLCFMSAVSNKLFYTGDEPPFDMSSGFKPFIMKRYLGQ